MAFKVLCPHCQFLVEKENLKFCPNCASELPKPATDKKNIEPNTNDSLEFKLPSLAEFLPSPNGEDLGADSLSEPIELNITIEKNTSESEKSKKSYPQGITIPEDDEFMVSAENEFDPSPPVPYAKAGGASLPTVLFPPAPKFRVVAAIIDFIAVFAIAFALWMLASAVAGFSGSIFQPNSPLWMPAALLFLAAHFTYHGWFNGLVGVSPGKALFKLRVINQSGYSPGFLKGALRGVAALAGLLLGGLNGAVVIAAKRGRGIHDLFFKTFVVDLSNVK
ncbi:MAG: hypothetical protein Kow0090_01500 [Myxococcota bacterium]